MTLADYVEVKDRIPIFWKNYPTGRIMTDLVKMEGPDVVFMATLYPDQGSEPIATGWAHEVIGSSNVNETSYVENCETSAIGRALANLGILGRDGAPRPSREEMQKVDRREATQPANYEREGATLTTVMRGGKHKGKTWGEILDEDPSYVRWCVENMDNLGEDTRGDLRRALEGTTLL